MILDRKSSTTSLSRIGSINSTPSSSKLKVKFTNPSPDSRGTTNKYSIISPKKINSSTRLNTLIDEESYRLDSQGIIEEDDFKLDSLGNDSYSSKSVIKSSSKPYVKVVKNLKRDLSIKSSKNLPENKSPGRFQNQRKDNSKSKLINSSKLSLYTSTSPGKNRVSKSPAKSNVFTTHRSSSKNVSVVMKKPILRKISIVNKEKDNGISLESLLNFELIKNFTSLNYKDIQLDELIYSAEISNVYRGKYLNLSVAIKVYDITKIKDEDIVRITILY
jgi:hypothetical protein